MKRDENLVGATLRVGDIMVRAPAPLRADCPLREAAERMGSTGAEALLVHDAQGHFLGLLTARRLVLAAQAQAHGAPGRAGDFVQREFVPAREDEPVEALLGRSLPAGDSPGETGTAVG